MITARLIGYKAIIKKEKNMKVPSIGTHKKRKIELNPLETLYLVDKNRISVIDKAGQLLDFDKLLKRFSKRDKDIFPKFLIYRDLMDRGYVVTMGYGRGIDLLVYDRGDYPDKPAKIRVVGIDEGRPIKIDTLINELNNSLLSKKELKIAVIERRGEIVYYSLSFFKGIINRKKGE